MDNTKFINMYGNAVRIVDISVVTNIIEDWNKNKEGKKEFTHFEFLIILNSGYEIKIRHTDIKEIKKQVTKILTAIVGDDIQIGIQKPKTKY